MLHCWLLLQLLQCAGMVLLQLQPPSPPPIPPFDVTRGRDRLEITAICTSANWPVEGACCIRATMAITMRWRPAPAVPGVAKDSSSSLRRRLPPLACVIALVCGGLWLAWFSFASSPMGPYGISCSKDEAQKQAEAFEGMADRHSACSDLRWMARWQGERQHQPHTGPGSCHPSLLHLSASSFPCLHTTTTATTTTTALVPHRVCNVHTVL